MLCLRLVHRSSHGTRGRGDFFAYCHVWNLSLDEIESMTGRILKRTTCLVNELGSTKCSFDSKHVLYSKLRPYLNKVVTPEESGVGTAVSAPWMLLGSAHVRAVDMCMAMLERTHSVMKPRVSK